MSKKDKKDFSAIVAISFIVLLIIGFFVYDFLRGAKLRNLNNKPPLLDLNDLKDKPGKDLLGKAELSFAGGTKGRNKNIELGVARINGKVVMPGEEFSFTKAIGSVTPEDGFSEERVFLNGEVTKGLGGGLCQVSTILFRSILSAGLPVTERHNHSFSVGLYDVGLDATFSDPGPDLKFVNDTTHPVTIKGETRDQKAIFEIYGISDGRIASTTEAEISQIVDFPATKYVATTTRAKEEPECVNNPQIGYTAKIVYNILYPTGQYKEQIFDSTYKPLQKVCYVAENKSPNSSLSAWYINTTLPSMCST